MITKRHAIGAIPLCIIAAPEIPGTGVTDIAHRLKFVTVRFRDGNSYTKPEVF
jgi:hypothetical protein